MRLILSAAAASVLAASVSAQTPVSPDAETVYACRTDDGGAVSIAFANETCRYADVEGTVVTSTDALECAISVPEGRTLALFPDLSFAYQDTGADVVTRGRCTAPE